MSDKKNEESMFAPPVHITTDIHAESTRLTERLLRVEAFMGTLPWKLDVAVEGSYREKLRFMRRATVWSLVWIDENQQTTTLAKDCSVHTRSRIAELLPVLLKAMREEFDLRAKLVKTGHDVLDDLERQLAVAASSGALPFSREGA